MLKTIEEYESFIELAGFTNVKIVDVEDFLKRIHQKKLSNVDIQLFDARFVATWEHLYFAALNALTAFKNGTNISKDLSIEIMLYASAQHQIQKAIKLIGIKPTSSEMVVLVMGKEPKTVKSALSIVSKQIDAKLADEVLELSEEKVATLRDIFEISDLELETVMEKGNFEKALTDLIIERMALLAIQN